MDRDATRSPKIPKIRALMGDAANASRRLPSILLARKPRFTDSRNETTATAESKGGCTMAVSFWMADPPQLSLFSVHSTNPHDLQHQDSAMFRDLPRVVGAEGRFVLFRAAFSARYGLSEYFLYKAGDAGESPSLERIPSPYEYDDDDKDDLLGVREFGILQLRGHYLVAALCLAPDAPSDYQLRIYSSERKSWSTMTLHNPCPRVDRIIPEKVITLGEGLLGWVDLSHGLLVCDLRQDPPDVSVSFIPLPEPLPGNRYKLKYPIFPRKKKKLEDSRTEASASWFRDITCVNGVLKFIEMENPAPEKQSDKDIIYDSDLIMSLQCKAVDVNSKQLSFRDAWRTVTWSRKVLSNFWRQTCTADVADIFVDGSMHSSLLSGLKGETVTQFTFSDLYSAFPILSSDGDDILYLKSLVEPSNRDGWVVAVDVGNKAVKAIGKYYLPGDFYYTRGHDPEHPFRACTLSRHLDMTPGTEVSACHKITEASSSANHPSNTPIRVDELNSRDPRILMQRTLELIEKMKQKRNAAESIVQNI